MSVAQLLLVGPDKFSARCRKREINWLRRLGVGRGAPSSSKCLQTSETLGRGGGDEESEEEEEEEEEEGIIVNDEF
jgi:hypothetical protein